MAVFLIKMSRTVWVVGFTMIQIETYYPGEYGHEDG